MINANYFNSFANLKAELIAAKFECVFMTAFGRPEVPLEKLMRATSFVGFILIEDRAGMGGLDSDGSNSFDKVYVSGCGLPVVTTYKEHY